ncbi:MAG: M24 family metallopeptidase [Halobacteriaceae archaeon]
MREDRLDALLEEHDVDAAWFVRPRNFAWITGRRNDVDEGAPLGAAAVGYDGDGLVVVADAADADRFREEVTPDARVESFAWHETTLPAAVAAASPSDAVADVDVPGLGTVDPAPYRRHLSDADADRYRELGRTVAAGVERICTELQPTDTERDVADGVRMALAAADVRAPQVLVGGADRAARYPRPTPTDAKLGSWARVSVTGERHGLHVSLTRTVAFADEDHPTDLADRLTAAATVEVTALGATQVLASLDRSAADLLPAIRAACEGVDHRDAWRTLPPGGATGFAPREWQVTPDEDAPVRTPLAYAYNPTVRGLRSEDTYLVGDDAVELLTATGDWPTARVDGYDYDVALPRHEVVTP